MSPGSRSRGGYLLGVPRASGDEPQDSDFLLTSARCSPRERG